MHVHESIKYSSCASTNAAICVSAQSFARAPQAQVVKVEERAWSMLVIWRRRYWIGWGLGGSRSYVRFGFGYGVEVEVEVKPGKYARFVFESGAKGHGLEFG